MSSAPSLAGSVILPDRSMAEALLADRNVGKGGIDPFSVTSIARTRTRRFIAVASTMRGDVGVRGQVKVEDGWLGRAFLKTVHPETIKEAVIFRTEAATENAAPSFMQEDVEKGVVNSNLAVVLDEA